ncbi:Envelopment polyprotein [Dissostichus eleginoides]|uniref:Envelopment polyprotein n=1 Tax=Dissostichus eleginoides TaxID=100907 RepID=A0AAD9BAS9_DISEL|nr:Envelopment polyprotein [Dissostichus eleginoides]KAK1878639.1 Envelopment polyprotein [Dissostichus eleginoides]
MMKAVLQPENAAPPSIVPSPPAVPALDLDSSSDSDLWLLVPDNHIPQLSVAPRASCPSGPSDETLYQSRPVPEASLHGVSSPSVPSTSTCPQALRRTVRSTAGHHSNVHHLPRPSGPQDDAASELARPVSNAQSVVFRPWC